MKKISFAAGGIGNFYNYVTYVAKDKKDNRCESTGLLIHFYNHGCILRESRDSPRQQHLLARAAFSPQLAHMHVHLSGICLFIWGGGDAYMHAFMRAMQPSDCHVFDCGPAADDVLATIGQVFTIMMEKKQPRAPSMVPGDEAMNPRACATC